jgi:hypothetical protein
MKMNSRHKTPNLWFLLAYPLLFLFLFTVFPPESTSQEDPAGQPPAAVTEGDPPPPAAEGKTPGEPSTSAGDETPAGETPAGSGDQPPSEAGAEAGAEPTADPAGEEEATEETPKPAGDPEKLLIEVQEMLKTQKFAEAMELLDENREVVGENVQLLEAHIQCLLQGSKPSWMTVKRTGENLVKRDPKNGWGNFALGRYFSEGTKSPDTGKALKFLGIAKSGKNAPPGAANAHRMVLVKKYAPFAGLGILGLLGAIVTLIKKRRAKKAAALETEGPLTTENPTEAPEEPPSSLDLSGIDQLKGLEELSSSNLSAPPPKAPESAPKITPLDIKRDYDPESVESQSDPVRPASSSSEERQSKSTVSRVPNPAPPPPLPPPTPPSPPVPSQSGPSQSSSRPTGNSSQSTAPTPSQKPPTPTPNPVPSALPAQRLDVSEFVAEAREPSLIEKEGLLAGPMYPELKPGTDLEAIWDRLRRKAGLDPLPVDFEPAKPEFNRPSRPIGPNPSQPVGTPAATPGDRQKEIEAYFQQSGRPAAPPISMDLSHYAPASPRQGPPPISLNVPPELEAAYITMDLTEESLREDLIGKLKMTAIEDGELRKLLLQRNPEHLPFLIEFIMMKPEPVKLAFLAREMGYYHDPAVVDVLTGLLYHDDPRVVVGAIQGLQECASGLAILAICPFLQAQIPAIADAAKNALTFFGPKQLLAAFQELKNQPDERVREAGVFILSRMKGRPVVDLLMSMLSDPSTRVRQKTILGMSFQKNPEYLEPLRDVFRSATHDEEKKLARKAIIYLQTFAPNPKPPAT